MNSPQELEAEGLVTIENSLVRMDDGRYSTVKEISQTWEQWKRQDLYERIGSDYTPEGIVRFKAWCMEHNVHFYSAPKEDFFPQEAFERAAKAGATYVLMENLS